MRIIFNGKAMEIVQGQKVLVAKMGSCRTYYGEFAYFDRVTKQHLVFVTESGAEVKTNFRLKTVGKAEKNHYFVSPYVEGRENDENFYKSAVMFWNSNKACYENK